MTKRFVGSECPTSEAGGILPRCSVHAATGAVTRAHMLIALLFLIHYLEDIPTYSKHNAHHLTRHRLEAISARIWYRQMDFCEIEDLPILKGQAGHRLMRRKQG